MQEKFRITNDLLASASKRFVNSIVDFIPYLVFAIFVGGLLGLSTYIYKNETIINYLNSTEDSAFDYLISYLIYFIYFVVF